MRTNWKIVERDPKALKWALMYVTLSPRGIISLSNFTWEKTGSPQAYLVLFDEAYQRIGLKPTATGVKHAYPVLSRGPKYGKKLNAFRMIFELGIKLEYGIRFTDIEIDPEGILILNLRTAETSKASTAWYRRREAQGQSSVVLESEKVRASPIDEARNPQ